ncbi:MAG: hypothetical protein P4L56_28250 [Candidatus Sulfopaludibacter sp.]|nr:hypothetical protein [Candidatus Sulfopaludibacter sp.]
MALEPFSLPYSQSAVGDLRERLRRTRWPDEIAGSGERGPGVPHTASTIREGS